MPHIKTSISGNWRSTPKRLFRSTLAGLTTAVGTTLGEGDAATVRRRQTSSMLADTSPKKMRRFAALNRLCGPTSNISHSASLRLKRLCGT